MEHLRRRPEGGEQPQQTAEPQPDQAAEASAVSGNVSYDYGYLSPIPPEGDSWDEWVIEHGIEAALREGRSIDDRTAQYIAVQLHEGQTSALYSLASTGAIDETRVYGELAHGAERQTESVRRWIRWLGGYCSLRPGSGPVEGWSQRIIQQDRAELEGLRRIQTTAKLDEIFGQQPNAQVGDAQETGWFGLVHHDDRPGGLILTEDEQGFRQVWETDSEAELRERWAAVQGAVDQEVDQQEAHPRTALADTSSVGMSSGHSEEPETAAQAVPDEPAGVASKRDRLAGLEERLAPLPDLGDIPRPTADVSQSGYEWLEQLPSGWHPEPSWGRDGWDLGAWPLIALALFEDEDRDRYAVATYVEGDMTVNRYQSRGALYVAVNAIAEFYWRLGQSRGPKDLPEGGGLHAKHCGPYSEERSQREMVQEAARAAAEQDPDSDV